MTLDIGCGETKDGGIGLDVRKISSVDIIGDIGVLPFRDNSFDCVYSSHVIEHFSHRGFCNIVSVWVRVLKNEGIVESSILILVQARAPTWQNVEKFTGGQDYRDSYHKCGFSFDLLKSMIELSGVIKLKRIISGYKGIPFIPDQFYIKGVKKMRI